MFMISAMTYAIYIDIIVMAYMKHWWVETFQFSARESQSQVQQTRLHIPLFVESRNESILIIHKRCFFSNYSTKAAKDILSKPSGSTV